MRFRGVEALLLLIYSFKEYLPYTDIVVLVIIDILKLSYNTHSNVLSCKNIDMIGIQFCKF